MFLLNKFTAAKVVKMILNNFGLTDRYISLSNKNEQELKSMNWEELENSVDFVTGPFDAIINTFESYAWNENELESYLKLILNCLDVTSLDVKDSDASIQKLASKILNLKSTYPSVPSVAGICVYPSLIEAASKVLNETNHCLVAVAGGFPASQIPLALKLREVEYALNKGANEIDIVMPLGKFLAREYQLVYDEITQIKKLVGSKKLKVILETGELPTPKHIMLASKIAIMAGADFIKSSTGKVKENATLGSIYIMSLAIKDHYNLTRKRVGLKPAGGVSTTRQALKYIKLVKEVLGKEWLNNELFRFGASSLADDVLAAIVESRIDPVNSVNYFKSNKGY